MRVIYHIESITPKRRMLPTRLKIRIWRRGRRMRLLVLSIWAICFSRTPSRPFRELLFLRGAKRERRQHTGQHRVPLRDVRPLPWLWRIRWLRNVRFPQSAGAIVFLFPLDSLGDLRAVFGLLVSPYARFRF